MKETNDIYRGLVQIRQLLELQSRIRKEILSFQDACIYLDMSASNLYKLTSSNRIEFFKPSHKKIYFKRSTLDEWMLQNPQRTIDSEINQLESSIRGRRSKNSKP